MGFKMTCFLKNIITIHESIIEMSNLKCALKGRLNENIYINSTL